MKTSSVNSLKIGKFNLNNYEEIAKAVAQAFEEFNNDVRECFVDAKVHTSAVHGIDDVRAQGFIVAIPSKDYQTMVNKAYLAFGTHFIDDFFDRPDLPPNEKIMKENRKDLPKIISEVPGLKEIDTKMAKRSKHPEAYLKGMERLMYGGLISLAKDESEQDIYLKEYKEIGKRFLDENLLQFINEIRDVVYWTTTKTIQEVLWAPDEDLNMNLSELWSILYSPAIYFHDNEDEIQKGEINFFSKKLPTLEEMTSILSELPLMLERYSDDNLSLRIVQLKYLIHSFTDVLPEKLLKAYKNLLDQITKWV